VLVSRGFLASILVLLCWRFASCRYLVLYISLPGAIGMLGVGLGIRRVQTTLPNLVYALLSGLNSATVGLIALAGVQLAERAIINKMTLLIVCSTGCIGGLYRGKFQSSSKISLPALWYYPTLLAVSGMALVVYDLNFVQRTCARVTRTFSRIRFSHSKSNEPGQDEETHDTGNLEALDEIDSKEASVNSEGRDLESGDIELCDVPLEAIVPYSARTGFIVLACFIVALVVVLTLKGVIHDVPSLYAFFSSIFLAGTIICGKLLSNTFTDSRRRVDTQNFSLMQYTVRSLSLFFRITLSDLASCLHVTF
jgi:hypothetical protein